MNIDNELIDTEFIEFIEKENECHIQPEVDLNVVLNLLIKENISVKVHNDGGFTGLATLWGLYFNLHNLWKYPNILKYYIILHEIGHIKRIKKYGESFVLSAFSEDDFDKFSDSIINEEILADRYASFAYYQLTGELFPISYTQKLHLPEYRERYKNMLKSHHTNIDNDIEKYKEQLKEQFNIDV